MRTKCSSQWKILLAMLGVAALGLGTISSVSKAGCGCGGGSAPAVAQPRVISRPVVAQAPVYVSAPVYTSAPVYSAPVVRSAARPCRVCAAPRVNYSCSACPAPVVVSCSASRPVSRTYPETEMREEEVTTYETVWDEETRYRERTVTRQVAETSVRQEKYTVSKPVWETVERESSYDVVRYVPETTEKEEVQTVCRPVTEYEERQYTETVNRPVTETVMQERCVTVNRPVTTCQTQIRDRGGYVTRYTPEPPKEYTRLTWQRGGEYFDPATGTTKTRLPGLYWTDLRAQPEYRPQQVWQPNLVSEQVQVTSYVPETIREQVPVTVNRVIQEQVTRTEQVPVTRMVSEQITKKIPVTTYKPVTERVVQKIPEKVCRMVTEERVRDIPVTTYKPVTEVIREPYTVKVARQVAKVTKVQRPVTVYKQYPVCDKCANASMPCEQCRAAGRVISGPNGCPVNTASDTAVSDTTVSDSTAGDSTPTLAEESSVKKPESPAETPAAEAGQSAAVRYPGPVPDDEVLSTEDPAIPQADAKTYSADNPVSNAGYQGDASSTARPAAAQDAASPNEAKPVPVEVKYPSTPAPPLPDAKSVSPSNDSAEPAASAPAEQPASQPAEAADDTSAFTLYDSTTPVAETSVRKIPTQSPTEFLRNR